MKLTDKQQQIMITSGHLLVTGGPGSGKTTVSILKAANVAEKELRPGQKVLFLSFARATVSRVIEAIEHEQQIPREYKNRIDVETYHSFFWRILKTHGYLIGLPRKLSILTPPGEAIKLSEIRSLYGAERKLATIEKTERRQKIDDERLRLAHKEGSICFDLFAKYVGVILHGSERIRELIATKYPIIIFDEFQDTNADQWYVVEAFGKNSTMLALADPEQRIYDWIGADPERLTHFNEAFTPTVIDLSSQNHRSGKTDIVQFGNDILTGKFRKGSYIGVSRRLYQPNPNQAWTALVTAALAARKRLIDSCSANWCLAILVPTKKMTRLVSDAFRAPPADLPKILHTPIIEMEAMILGAEIIAFLMQSNFDDEHFDRFVDLLCNYFSGKGGDSPTKKDLQEAQRIKAAYNELSTRRSSGQMIRANSILVEVLAVYDKIRSTVLVGNPDDDWRVIRGLLEDGDCPRLKRIAEDVRNLRLLNRGTQLRQALSQDWRDTGAYANALAIIRKAFVKEHFSTTYKPETGVIVMNMHKAKGKQFDEVIIFEGWPKKYRGKILANPNRIVRGNFRDNDIGQARRNFRVSVTRGKSGVTILTPKGDPCVLLLDEK